MEESVVYQGLRASARKEAYREVRAKLRAEVRAEVCQEVQLEEGRSLILRQLGRRVGTLPNAVRSSVKALSVVQLESLGEALLDFFSLTDFATWLAEHPEASGGN